MPSVLTCLDYDAATATCSQFQLIEEVYLIPLSSQSLIELMSTGGFSIEVFELAVGGYFSLLAAGMAVGLIVAQLRKLKP